MKDRIVAVLGMVGVLVSAGCASTNNPPPATPQTTAAAPAAPAVGVTETTTMTARVQAIDLKTRKVTLKPKNGKAFTIQVSEDARNLPQVRVGDTVVAKYTEAVAVDINRDTSTGGVTSRKESVSGTRAPLGAMPGGTVRNTVEIIANVLAIDAKTRRVTFQGPENTLTVKVPAEVKMNKLEVGDQVRLTYVEELAISVERTAPAKGAAKKK
jgi:Cu/Ag efflux protein CusF